MKPSGIIEGNGQKLLKQNALLVAGFLLLLLIGALYTLVVELISL